MHGLIHVMFKDCILSNFGVAAWEKVLARIGVNNELTMLKMMQYDDALTYETIKMSCEVVGIEPRMALKLFGSHFARFAYNAGYHKHLKALGKNLIDMLANLNLLHHNLERDFRTAVFPVFCVEKEHDSDDTTFVLKYNSSRIGFESFACAALVKVADLMYDADLEIESLKSPKYTGFPRAALDSEDTKVIWRLRVHLREPSEPREHASSCDFSFFFFRAAIASFFKCNWTTMASPAPAALTSTQLTNGQELAELLERKSSVIKTSKDPISASTQQRLLVSIAFFRGVVAHKLASTWTDADSLAVASEFWSAYTKLDKYYLWSDDLCVQSSVDVHARFLSHSWAPPANWEDVMGKGVLYSEIKATEVCGVAKDLAAAIYGDPNEWTNIHFWVDKCCIPQTDKELMRWHVSLLEEFIMLSDGLVVILTWTYLERLWCVYEWVCFLVSHGSQSIILCADVFMRPRSVPMFVRCIRNFSVASCKCTVEVDRALLYAKIDAYFNSRLCFEEMLKFTTIALIARDMAVHRPALGMDAVLPWVELAEECGFHDLATHLRSLGEMICRWRSQITAHGHRSLTLDSQTALIQKVDEWFLEEVEPLIEAMRDRSVKLDVATQLHSRTKHARYGREEARSGRHLGTPRSGYSSVYSI